MTAYYCRTTQSLAQALEWASAGSYHETGRELAGFRPLNCPGCEDQRRKIEADEPDRLMCSTSGAVCSECPRTLAEVVRRERAEAALRDAEDTKGWHDAGATWPARESFGPVKGAVVPTFAAGYGRSRIVIADYGAAAGYRVTVEASPDAIRRADEGTAEAVRNRAVMAFGPSWVAAEDEARHVRTALAEVRS